MPKRSCTDRAKWRLLRGKPAQPLSAHYQLDCDYGTPVLTIYREGEGDTPTYLCEVHAAAERDAATAARPVSCPTAEDRPIGDVNDVILHSDCTDPVSDPPVPKVVEHPASRPVQRDRSVPAAEPVVAKRSPRARKPSVPAPTPNVSEPKSSAQSTKSAAPPLTPATRPVTPSSPGPKPNVPVAKLNALASTEAVLEPMPPAAKVPPVKVNSSPKGSARDLTYGNPAKALVDETIWNLQPGDYDAYRTALREGKSVTEAAQAAGGQLAVVHRKIQEYTVRIDALLAASNAAVDVDHAIHAILESEVMKIIGDDATADAQKDAALARLGELQEWINRSLKPVATPLKTYQLALAIAERANWGAACDAVPNDLSSAYRTLYTSLRDAVHSAVPDVRDPDERLANLQTAKSDLDIAFYGEPPAPAPSLTVGPSSLSPAREENSRDSDIRVGR